MSITVVVDIPGVKALETTLGNQLPMWTAVGARFLELFNKNWESQGGLWGKWAPIKQSTAFAKGAGPPLRGTQLRQSFRVQPNATGLVFGSPLKHARYHQEGRYFKWNIYPKAGKALSFPWPFGASLGGQAKAAGGKIKVNRIGAQSFHVGRGKLIRTVSFRSLSNAKASMGALGGGSRGVFAHVVHPGYPARKMLPHKYQAEQIARDAGAAFITWILRGKT